MPTNRTRRTRKFKPPGISQSLEHYLSTGEYGAGVCPDCPKLAETFLLAGSKQRLLEVWQSQRDTILSAWIDEKPCSRPAAWWWFDTPRWTRKFGAWFDGTLPEPRKRLGGIGTEAFEVLNYVPQFEFGLPTSFVTPFLADYYNGRAKDVHGNLIKCQYKEGDFKGVAIDSEDPPTFEAEASYLQRHGLLTKAEEKYLERHQELLEPEKIKFDDE